MRAAVLALVGVLMSGCSFQHGSLAGNAVDAATAVDAEYLDVALSGVDTDSDGIDDAIDNCVTVANADQFNEDKDDRGDACDACPHLAGTLTTGDADDDGDGIGNQCDPRVGTDRRVVFLGFNNATERTAFALRAGSDQWSVSGGQLHQTDATIAVPQNIVWTGETITGTVVAETHVHLDAVPTGTGTRLAAVVGGYYDGTTVDAYACGLRGSDADVPATVAAWHFVNPPTIGVSSTAATTGTMSAGKEAFVHLLATDQTTTSTLDCLADASPLSLAVPSYVPDGYPGFRTLNVTASFDYLFVVDVGP